MLHMRPHVPYECDRWFGDITRACTHARSHTAAAAAASSDESDMKYDIRAECGFTLRCPAVAAVAVRSLVPLPWLSAYCLCFCPGN